MVEAAPLSINTMDKHEALTTIDGLYRSIAGLGIFVGRAELLAAIEQTALYLRTQRVDDWRTNDFAVHQVKTIKSFLDALKYII